MSKVAARHSRGAFQERLHRLEARSLFIAEVARTCPAVFGEFQALVAAATTEERQKAYEEWRQRWHLQMAATDDWVTVLAWVAFRRHDHGRSQLPLPLLANLWKANVEFEGLKAMQYLLSKLPSPEVSVERPMARVKRMPLESRAAFEARLTGRRRENEDVKERRARYRESIAALGVPETTVRRWKEDAIAVERMPFETESAFLKRARLHSKARGEIFNRHGLSPRTRPTLAEHVGWFVRYQLKLESYTDIHASLGVRNITRQGVRMAIRDVSHLLTFSLRSAR